MIDNTTIIDNQDEAVLIEDYAKMVLGQCTKFIVNAINRLNGTPSPVLLDEQLFLIVWPFSAVIVLITTP